jgi:NADH:ubiquinone oxidoreductase subunit E
MNTSDDNLADRVAIDEIISRHNGKPGSLLTMMEEMQETNEYKFLDSDAMSYLSAQTKTPLSQIPFLT